MLLKVEERNTVGNNKCTIINSVTDNDSFVGKEGRENWAYACHCDTDAVSFAGAATRTDMSHNFPLADILLTRVMSKHSHVRITFLLLESLSSLGFCDSLLFSTQVKLLASRFLTSFDSSFCSPYLPLHFKEPQTWPWVSSSSSTLDYKKN